MFFVPFSFQFSFFLFPVIVFSLLSSFFVFSQYFPVQLFFFFSLSPFARYGILDFQCFSVQPQSFIACQPCVHLLRLLCLLRVRVFLILGVWLLAF